MQDLTVYSPEHVRVLPTCPRAGDAELTFQRLAGKQTRSITGVCAINIQIHKKWGFICLCRAIKPGRAVGQLGGLAGWQEAGEHYSRGKEGGSQVDT